MLYLTSVKSVPIHVDKEAETDLFLKYWPCFQITCGSLRTLVVPGEADVSVDPVFRKQTS